MNRNPHLKNMRVSDVMKLSDSNDLKSPKSTTAGQTITLQLGSSLLSFLTARIVIPSQRQRENKMNNQNTRLIRLPEVMNKTGYGKAWIYRLINEGLFPKPIKIGTRAIAFIESEIDEWIVSAIERSRKNAA